MGAISKLQGFAEDNEKIIEHPETNKITKYVSLTRKDVGFRDLLAILEAKNLSFAGMDGIKTCDEIRLMRTSTKSDIDSSKLFSWFAQIFGTPPEIPPELNNPPNEVEWLTILSKGKQLDKIVYSGGVSPLEDFYKTVEDWLRIQLSFYIIGMLGLYLLLNFLSIFFANYHL